MEIEQKSIKLIQTGAEVFGGAIGSAIGLIGGPAGAIGGNVAGIIIAKGLNELANRYLSNREQARTGAAASYTIFGVQKKLDEGLTPRQDGFFDSTDTKRSKAEELFEGILLKCKNEFEEKKIAYISNIYQNVAFDNTINPFNANQILYAAQQMTYRQISILALIGVNINNHLTLRDQDYRDDYDNVSTDLEFILQDFVYLEKQGLIVRGDHTAIIDASDVVPGKMKLSLIGYDFYKILSLSVMKFSEMDFLALLK